MSRSRFSWFDWVVYLGGALLLTALLAIAENRYQPQTMTERVVGFFMLGGDLLTGGEGHPRDVINWLERKSLPQSD